MPRIEDTGPPGEGDIPAEIARDTEVAAAVSAHVAASDPHPTYETSAEAQAKVDAHAAAGDPHTGYQKESEKDAAGGYAGLDANRRSADLAPAASKATFCQRKSRASSNLSLNNTSWADADTGLDLTVTAKSGDWLLVTISGRWSNEAVSCYLDVATMVGGSPVNYISGSGGGGATYRGIQGWVGQTGVTTMIGGGLLYQVQSGDVSSGTVTLRLRYRTSSAAAKVLFADADDPLIWAVRNEG